MPKVVDETEQRDEIAEAAVEVFADHGFSETSVREVADAAGMSKGNIYLYFDSKNEILDRIFQNFESNLHEILDKHLLSSGDPLDKIEALLDDLMMFLRKNRSTFKVLFDFWSYSLHTSKQSLVEYEPFYRRIQEKLVAVLEEGAQAGTFRRDWNPGLPSILIGFFEGQIVQWLVNPNSPSLENIKNSIFELLVSGLANKDKTKT